MRSRNHDDNTQQPSNTHAGPVAKNGQTNCVQVGESLEPVALHSHMRCHDTCQAVFTKACPNSKRRSPSPPVKTQPVKYSPVSQQLPHTNEAGQTSWALLEMPNANAAPTMAQPSRTTGRPPQPPTPDPSCQPAHHWQVLIAHVTQPQPGPSVWPRVGAPRVPRPIVPMPGADPNAG